MNFSIINFGLIVSSMSKPSKPVSVQIYSQRIVRSDQNINSYIEFLTTNQKRITDIALNNVRLCRWMDIWLPLRKLAQFIHKKNPFTLRLACRLHYPCVGMIRRLISLEFIRKQTIFWWQQISLWIEIVASIKK